MTSGRVWTRLPTLRFCATREGTCASIGAAAAVRALTSTRRIPAMKEQFSGHGVEEAVLERGLRPGRRSERTSTRRSPFPTWGQPVSPPSSTSVGRCSRAAGSVATVWADDGSAAAGTGQPAPERSRRATAAGRGRISYFAGSIDERRASPMAEKGSFSRRNRYVGEAKPITIREEAPEGLRTTILNTAKKLGLGAKRLRPIICQALNARPDPFNWTEYPNIWEEVQRLMYECDWFRVYDIIEDVYAILDKDREPVVAFADFDDEDEVHAAADCFADAINAYFLETGVGWQLVEGQIVTRGTKAFESVVRTTATALDTTGRPTASKHLDEALRDLSRRPKGDLEGAIHHAMGALEAVARDVTGNSKPTLGDVIKRNPDLFPKPLDEVVSKLWGYSSNYGRHVAEGREPSREDAEFVVGTAAVMANYLIRESGRSGSRAT